MENRIGRLLREELEQMLVEQRNDELTAVAEDIQEQLLFDWTGEKRQEVRKELKYDSALLAYIERFLKKLDSSRHAALRLGALLGTVESLERLQYEQNQTAWAEARFSKEPVKHLREVVQALETHGTMTHTELSEYLKMNAPTLTEAMKKIVNTGVVQTSSIGKYKLYSLTDEGLRYGKELRRRRNENISLTEICEQFVRLWKNAEGMVEQQRVKATVMALLGDADDLNIRRGDILQIRDLAFPQKVIGVLQAESGLNVVGSSGKNLFGNWMEGLDKVSDTRMPKGGCCIAHRETCQTPVSNTSSMLGDGGWNFVRLQMTKDLKMVNVR